MFGLVFMNKSLLYMKYKELKEIRDNYLRYYLDRGLIVSSNFPTEYKLPQRDVDLNRSTINWITEGTQFIPHFKPIQYIAEEKNLRTLAQIAGYVLTENTETKIAHKIQGETFTCGIKLPSKDISKEYDVFGFENEIGFICHSKNDPKDIEVKYQTINNQLELWNTLYDLHILPVKPHVFADMMRLGLIHNKK